MEANTEPGKTDESRKKRIRFLRRLILVSIATAIIVPICICLLLAIRYDKVSNKLDRAIEELAWYEQQYGETALAEGMGDEKPLITDDGSSDEAEAKQTTSTGSGEDIPVAQEDNAEVVAGNPDEKSDVILENADAESSEWDGTRRVYLTFDDGPSATTGEILDILDEYGVKATFFVTGKEGEKYADVYKRIVDNGHTIGMHSYSHQYSELYSSLESFATDLQKLQTFLYETTGSWCTLYRFPGGSSNTVSKVSMRDLIDYLGLENITYYDWNVASSDDRSGITKDIIVANVMTGIPKFQNAVVLLHDAPDKRTTIEALPEIIEQVQSMENTVIVPITEDTLPVQHISNSQ